MTMEYTQLVAAFKELMETGEKDQWKLAEIAYLASSKYGGSKAFATDVGRTEGTINKYVAAFKWNENLVADEVFSFADALVLANMSQDRATAVQILAGATGKPIGTVKSDTEAINIVKDFLVGNPELVKDALKDEDARSAVASAAFKAASEEVVAEATGVTKEAAKAKAPKKNASHRAVEVEQVKYKATQVGRWALGNVPSLIREVEALAPYMTSDELTYVYDQLGHAYDLIAGARVKLDELVKASV